MGAYCSKAMVIYSTDHKMAKPEKQYKANFGKRLKVTVQILIFFK